MKIKIREKLQRKEFFCAPGIQDMITAVIARDLGIETVYASGYWTAASAYGIPDVGIMTYTQMLERITQLTGVMADAAVIADADTGFGGLLNVRETVRGYENAGVQVIQIEDQEFPKKCGHTKNARLVPSQDMVAKIRVAVDSRRHPDTLIAARTDARQGEGLDAVLRRVEAYAEAGADIVFPEALLSEKEMQIVCESVDTPLMANMVDGGCTPVLSAEVLSEIGYSFAIFPAMTSLVAAAAMKKALKNLQETGTSLSPDVSPLDFQEFCSLIGFEDVWAFEEQWLENNAGKK